MAGAIRAAAQLAPTEQVLINLSGRGDKDIFTMASALGDDSWASFLRHKADAMMAAKTSAEVHHV